MVMRLATRGDAVRYAALRVCISAGLTVVLTGATIGATVGIEPNVMVRAGFVMVSSLIISFIISVALTGALSYRSALVMRELNIARAELQHISRTDQLTGLLNRRGFDEAAGSIIADASKAKKSVIALMCDIDRFKAINDQFGHEFGDKVLIEVAKLFSSFGKQNDVLVARHGGEEFAVLIVGASVEQAMMYANQLRRACSGTELLSDNASTHVTISIGLAASENATDLNQTMRIADQGLYKAKHHGRDRVARADDSRRLQIFDRAVVQAVV